MQYAASTGVIQAFWGAYQGSFRREQDHVQWDACQEDTESPLWLVLECSPPYKLPGKDENAPGVRSSAYMIAHALPRDPAPLHVSNPLDWPKILLARFSGATYQYDAAGTLELGQKRYGTRMQKDAIDWSFISTDYELILPHEAYEQIAGTQDETLELRFTAPGVRLQAKFHVSANIRNLLREMQTPGICRRTEPEAHMSPTDWADFAREAERKRH